MPESAEQASATRPLSGQENAPKASQSPPPGQEAEKSKTEDLRIVGGLVALVIGLFVLLGIVLAAIFHLEKEAAGAAATAGITAIASMVRAYFGVKVGSDGTKEAIKGQKEQATKAQAFALAAD